MAETSDRAHPDTRPPADRAPRASDLARPDPWRALSRFTAARIGLGRVENDDGTFFWAEVDVLELAGRLEKANDVATAIQRRGLGYAVATQLGLQFSARDGVVGEWWFAGLRRAKDNGERKRVQKAVAEWADADSIAAHVGYGIDFFCSEDEGKNTGSEPSVLDPDNRAWLAATFCVKFVDLAELAAMV
jgi:hypothetical protein